MFVLLKNILRRDLRRNLAVAKERVRYLFSTGYLHTSERVCPAFADEVFENHVKVYRFIQQWTVDNEVLDIGCGTGYGAAILAERAKQVYAIDYSRQALRYARKHYVRPNLSFSRMSAQQLDFPSASFDFVMSSEVFEHLDDQAGHLAEVARVLRPDGICFVGTPNPEWSAAPSSGFHVKENTFGELHDLLAARFTEVVIIENMEEPKDEEQRVKKQVRRAQGDSGLDPFSSLSLFGQPVDSTYLHNSRSFMCFARK
jgi:2-polyprenyl-3-methyl-5-hydroxy-6-metoxy-1,4-benzoquinol methylase